MYRTYLDIVQLFKFKKDEWVPCNEFGVYREITAPTLKELIYKASKILSIDMSSFYYDEGYQSSTDEMSSNQKMICCEFYMEDDTSYSLGEVEEYKLNIEKCEWAFTTFIVEKYVEAELKEDEFKFLESSK